MFFDKKLKSFDMVDIVNDLNQAIKQIALVALENDQMVLIEVFP